MSLKYGIVTDIDGNKYATIIIGEMEWMAENLRTTRFRNGDSIPQVRDNNKWLRCKDGAWAYYNNDYRNGYPYGKLYNWYAVNDNRNICPVGWHVPSQKEWDSLFRSQRGRNFAGLTLKSTGNRYWQHPNSHASNTSGFSGLPGGQRLVSGTFRDINLKGYWWSSTQTDTTISTFNAWSYSLSHNQNIIFEGAPNKGFGYSVRCVKKGKTKSLKQLQSSPVP